MIWNDDPGYKILSTACNRCSENQYRVSSSVGGIGHSIKVTNKKIATDFTKPKSLSEEEIHERTQQEALQNR